MYQMSVAVRLSLSYMTPDSYRFQVRSKLILWRPEYDCAEWRFQGRRKGCHYPSVYQRCMISY
jgi:hypothetical protein